MKYLFRRSLGLRIRITLGMAGFGIAAGVFMSLVVNRQLEQELEPAARGRLHAIAGEVAAVLGQSLRRHDQELALLSALLVDESGAGLAAPMRLRSLIDLLKARQPACAWIGVADPAGRVVAGSGGLLEGVDVSHRPWHAAGLRGPYASDPHAATLLARLVPPAPDGEPVRFVDVARPLRTPQGQLVGVIAMHLYWHWLDALVAEAAARHQSTPIDIRVLDRYGRWLSELDRPATPSGVPVESGEADYLSVRAPLGVHEGTAALGWSVLVRQRRSEVFAPLAQQQRFMLLLAPGLALLFAAGTWVIAGRLVRPILRLAEMARHHDRGADASGDETQVVDRALRRLANSDALTGVGNLGQLGARLTALSTRADHETLAALVLVDIDDFGIFNNSHGRGRGDRLLQALAEELSGRVRHSDLVVRTGGGKFAVLLDPLGTRDEVARRTALDLAQRVDLAARTTLAQTLGTGPIRISVGVLVLHAGSSSADEMLKDVELAAREAQRQGGGRAVTFSADLQARFSDAVLLESELRRAIVEGTSLMLHYQPQVDARGHCIGAELLVRWHHPELGMISPARFIPIAEETGLIVPLGQWVLESACRQIAAWSTQPRLRDLVLAVNVSAHELARADYPGLVAGLIERTGADPRRLKLELTESVLARDLDSMVQRMAQLRALGLGLSLDDFGTGFSSLTYLSRLPIDQLKIDQSFTRELDGSGQATSIARTIIALGQGLGLSVIAEGVEHESQRRTLLDLGCTLFQGYLTGRPMPVAQFEQQVREAERVEP
jgi:diguanylate cyclase (GGDEF)-like protein